MQADAAIQLIRELLVDDRLSDLQESVFRDAWHGLSYPDIASHLGYDQGYILSVGYQIWQSLSERCGQPITKKNFKSVLAQYAQRCPVSASTEADAANPHCQSSGLGRLP